MRFYLTTPIYYVNSTPHLGHAYTTIAADILVRHHRQRGDDTFFLTGTDENASKNVRSAEEAGVDPKAFVDRLVEEHWRPLPGRVEASPDFFIRTTDEQHHRFVREFLQRIYDNGDIYESAYSGLYCVSCETFYTEADAPDGMCPDHGTKLEQIDEKNYFFRLSAYQERLLQIYDERPDFVLPGFRANEARRFIEGGLQDISVSRAGQPWGIPVPWDESQVVYVWVDALINYLSALTYAHPDEDLRDRYWPAARHLIGKDILRFHCIIWPALLLAAGYEVPKQIFVHGYLLLDDKKISKSRGNVVDPLELIDVYGADPVRYWCARAVSFGQDGSASIDGIHERYERELGNDFGNLLSRTTAMIARYRDGSVGRASGDRPVSLDELCEGVSLRGSTASTSRARSRSSGSPSGASTSTSRPRPPGRSRRTRAARASSTPVLANLAEGALRCSRSRSPPTFRPRRRQIIAGAPPESGPDFLGARSARAARSRPPASRRQRLALPGGWTRPTTAA